MIEGFDEIVLAWEKHELFSRSYMRKRRGIRQNTANFCLRLNVKELREQGLVVPDLYDTLRLRGNDTDL